MAILATLHALVTTTRPARRQPVLPATDDELLELAEAFGVVRTPAACPEWCALPAGHAPELADGSGSMTVHRSLAPAPDGGRLLDVAAFVFVRADGTSATYSPVKVVEGRPAATTDALVGGAR